MNNSCRFLAQSFMWIYPTLVIMLWFGALSVRAEYFYVATNGNHTTFRTWEYAATNIQDAVNAATNDDIVLVSNGVYTTTSPIFTDGTNNIVVLTNRITLKSVNGPATTVIDGNYPVQGFRCVYVSSNATLEGFTVRNGYVSYSSASKAGGIYLLWGIVTNCIVHNNYSRTYGGGIYIVGGPDIVANCTIYSNTAGMQGGGINATWTTEGTMVKNCVFWGNKTTTGHVTPNYWGGGGLCAGTAVKMSVRNCLFYKNESIADGGGVQINNDTYNYIFTLENCTIVSNIARFGGGFSMSDTNTQARNLIIYNNSCTGNYADAWTTNLNVLTNCAIGDTNGVPNWNTSGNITNNPRFIDVANNNYRLLASSPCINTGTNQSWMTDGVDLDNRPRIRYRWVDMGAYEHINRGTIYSF